MVLIVGHKKRQLVAEAQKRPDTERLMFRLWQRLSTSWRRSSRIAREGAQMRISIFLHYYAVRMPTRFVGRRGESHWGSEIMITPRWQDERGEAGSFTVQRQLEVAVRSVQLRVIGGRGRDRLNDVGHGGERMHGSNNKLIEFGIVCYQLHSFAIPFRHKKCGGVPICELRTRDNHARSYMFSNLTVSCFLEAQRNGPR